MRHLLVMGKKSNLFIPPKKTLDEDPHTDVLLTVKNTIEQKEFKENQVYPETIEQ